MKKTIGIVMITALFLGGNTAYASTSIDDLIAQLQQQIILLSSKLEALKQVQGDARSAGQSVNSTLAQIGSLSEGMTGDQVTLLQATLANDSSIYPEGLVTGYYGKLTREAIKRFQKSHGLKGDGTLNAKTLAELNKKLSESSFEEEDDDNDGDHEGDKKRFCNASASWKQDGHDNGKHRGWDKVNLPRCKHIPAPTPVPTPTDTVAPIVSAITVGSINSVGATITWSTNEVASSHLYVSATSPVATSTAAWNDGVLRSAHTAVLNSLTASTNYHFVIEATDASSNKTLSTEGSFTTSATPDTTAPVISGVSVVPTGSTTGTAVWTTNEAASSRVYYGTTSPFVTSSASSFFDAAFVTTHSMPLTGLEASTTYAVVVESVDASTNIGTSSESTFTTQL